LSVPIGRSSFQFPGTVTTIGLTGCLNARWLPFCRTNRHRFDSNNRTTSRTFIPASYDSRRESHASPSQAVSRSGKIHSFNWPSGTGASLESRLASWPIWWSWIRMISLNRMPGSRRSAPCSPLPTAESSTTPEPYRVMLRIRRVLPEQLRDAGCRLAAQHRAGDPAEFVV